jgi:DNA-binding response OmpR family regulator
MKASILVVDDQLAIALATKKRLMDQGFEVDTASNGEEALTRIEQKNYDIVLLDVNMPIMNGIQVLEFITAKHPYSDVMMMTAFDDYSLASECLKKGAKDYLLKPIDYTELVSRINSLLRVRDSEHRFVDLRNFWQSTVLFDVFGSIQSIQFILNHAIESMMSVVPEKDLALLAHARDMNSKITQTLKNSTTVNDHAVCDRWNRCANCALKDHVQETDVAEGVFLHGQSDTNLGALIQRVVDRYEPCFREKEIVFQQVTDPQLPLVKCDPERVEQVVNSIFETGIVLSKPKDRMNIALSTSAADAEGVPSACVVCTIQYSNRATIPQDLLNGLTEQATEWKNIDNALTANTMNLAISRRILEAQGGAFEIGASEDNRLQIKFTLPLA